MIRVLLADDEEIELAAMAKFIRQRLADKATVVAMARTGQEAVDNAQHTQPDVAMLDVKMPGMDGLQAGRAIRAISPRTRLIVVTAYGEFEFARRAIEIGVSGYLLKPCDPDEIITALTGDSDRGAPVPVPAPVTVEESVHSLQAYIDHHYSQTLDMREMAARIHVSPSHFSRLFKQVAGVGFNRYVTGLRLRAALKLLLETDRPVEDVARRSGFRSHAYFCQAFRKRYGKSPTECRAEHRALNSQKS